MQKWTAYYKSKILDLPLIPHKLIKHSNIQNLYEKFVQYESIYAMKIMGSTISPVNQTKASCFEMLSPQHTFVFISATIH